MKNVIEMAREAWRNHPMYGGVDIPDPEKYDLAALERFADLVREDERERLYQAIRNAETPATQLTLGQQNMIKEVLK